MPARIGLLGLGSNVGDRRAQLQSAVDALPGAGVRVLACSSAYDTDPVGDMPDQASFLNVCVRVETALDPLPLLDAVKDLERALGRVPGAARHGPRAIDIDILLLGDIVLAHERMTLPHGQLLARRFVLIPALESRLRADHSLRSEARRRAGRASAGGGRALGRTAADPALRRASVSDVRGRVCPRSRVCRCVRQWTTILPRIPSLSWIVHR